MTLIMQRDIILSSASFDSIFYIFYINKVA